MSQQFKVNAKFISLLNKKGQQVYLRQNDVASIEDFDARDLVFYATNSSPLVLKKLSDKYGNIGISKLSDDFVHDTYTVHATGELQSTISFLDGKLPKVEAVDEVAKAVESLKKTEVKKSKEDLI